MLIIDSDCFCSSSSDYGLCSVWGRNWLFIHNWYTTVLLTPWNRSFLRSHTFLN